MTGEGPRMGYLVACCNRGGCLKSVSHKNPRILPGNDLYQVLGARHFTPPSCCSKELHGVKDATTLRVSMRGWGEMSVKPTQRSSSPASGSTKGHPQNQAIFLRVLSKHFLKSGRLGAVTPSLGSLFRCLKGRRKQSFAGCRTCCVTALMKAAEHSTGVDSTAPDTPV